MKDSKKAGSKEERQESEGLKGRGREAWRREINGLGHLSTRWEILSFLLSHPSFLSFFLTLYLPSLPVFILFFLPLP